MLKSAARVLQINKPAGAGCDDSIGCTTTDECFGAGCGLAGAAGALGVCQCNIKTVDGKDVYQNTDNAYCRDEDNGFGDAYTCSCALACAHAMLSARMHIWKGVLGLKSHGMLAVGSGHCCECRV